MYDPLKVMEIPVEGEYADVPGPAVLVCDGGACSPPIRDPAALDAFSKRLR